MARPTEPSEGAVGQAVTQEGLAMKRGNLLLLGLLLIAAGSSGCAGVALTLFGVGAGLSGNTATSYILDSYAYKTFSAPEEGLHAATLKTLKRMDVQVKENQATEFGRTIVAVAGDRTIEIELDRLTTRASRMRVTAKRGWLFRDRATAEEIIVQTERTLDDEPVLARRTTLSAAAPKQVGSKEAGKRAEPAAKSPQEKVEDGSSPFGASVRNFLTRLFGN